MKRVVLLFGAGASVEYKAPSTLSLTNTIEREVMADPYLRQIGGDIAFGNIKAGLCGYLTNPGIVNFEHIYHCAHELMFTYAPSPGACDEYKPVLLPFLSNTTGLTREALRGLCQKIVKIIITEASNACSSNPLPLSPLSQFIEVLRGDYITRIYTTNYDDFVLQATPDLYIGFDSAPRSEPRRFDLNKFWCHENADAILHLHGSVHMGFPHAKHLKGDIGELFWFDDRNAALQQSSFSGSSPSRMDGTSILRTAIITGLDKLSRLQQRPLSHFYGALARDIMRADLIFVIGSGLADLHLNTWLAETRARAPAPPLLFVDFWQNGFEQDTFFEIDSKLIQLLHPLKVHITERMRGTRIGSGWRVSEDRTAAVWDKGFQDFLNAPAELQQVMSELRGAQRPHFCSRVARRVHRRWQRWRMS